MLVVDFAVAELAVAPIAIAAVIERTAAAARTYLGQP